MNTKISNRVRNIEHSATYEILDLVNRLRSGGVNILDFGGGEPNFSTPEHISKRAINQILKGNTHYTPSRGNRDLLEAISDKLLQDNQIQTNPQTDIIVTPSAKHGLFITLMSILDPGDEIIIPTPSWVSYQAMVKMSGAKSVVLPLSTENNFALTREKLIAKVNHKTKAILINTPNNPTGHMLTQEEVSILISVACEYDLILVVDEIYEKVIYDGKKHISLASKPLALNRTITINGFSKFYAMTGWRLGYIAGPSNLVSEILKVQQHSVGCAGSFIQEGGLEALVGNQAPLLSMLNSYASRRKLIVDGLNSIPGIQCGYPDGALYVFPNIKGVGFKNCTDFTQWLLEKVGVAVTPGTAFGNGGEDHVRLSFATSNEIICQALEKIHGAIISAK